MGIGQSPPSKPELGDDELFRRGEVAGKRSCRRRSALPLGAVGLVKRLAIHLSCHRLEGRSFARYINFMLSQAIGESCHVGRGRTQTARLEAFETLACNVSGGLRQNYLEGLAPELPEELRSEEKS